MMKKKETKKKETNKMKIKIKMMKKEEKKMKKEEEEKLWANKSKLCLIFYGRRLFVVLEFNFKNS